jgi:hypothetical protein
MENRADKLDHPRVPVELSKYSGSNCIQCSKTNEEVSDGHQAKLLSDESSMHYGKSIKNMN